MSICLAVAAAVASSAPARAGVTEDNFLARTTNDLVAVCAAEQADPLYTAAANFCEGFAIGTTQALHEVAAAGRSFQLFCMADPGPSRNETIAAFVTWARAHPELGGRLPSESIAAFLAERFPCKPATAATRPAHVSRPAGGSKP